MDFTSIILDFLSTYQIYIFPMFALGVIMFIAPTYSIGLGAFSVVSLVLYSIFNIPIFVYIGIATLVLAFVAKYLGL